MNALTTIQAGRRQEKSAGVLGSIKGQVSNFIRRHSDAVGHFGAAVCGAAGFGAAVCDLSESRVALTLAIAAVVVGVPAIFAASYTGKGGAR